MITYKAIYGVIIAMLIVSIGLVIYAIYIQRVVESPPVELTPAHVFLSEKVCPGEKHFVETMLIVNRPAVIETSVVFINTETRRIVRGSEFVQPDRPRPEAEEIVVQIPIIIPDLSPGTYDRVTALSEKSGGADPAFFVIRFTVDENCTSPEE